MAANIGSTKFSVLVVFETEAGGLTKCFGFEEGSLGTSGFGGGGIGGGRGLRNAGGAGAGIDGTGSESE